ncbi:PKD domain-containing protein [Candidatus Pacearchaeota archaeon]|nr:PKD domain-containing protein [Candidatus Pacearchaeota archaeon]
MNQNLVLKDLSVNYDIGGGLIGSANKFYDLSETPSTVNSKFQRINLDEGNFSVSSDYGENTFELSLGGEEIFSEGIIIKSASLIKNLKPKITASAIPTEFEVLVNSSNIAEYEWSFGDGTNATTTVNKVTHMYDEIGVYELKITVTDFNQLSFSKTFKIDVISPQQAIEATLKKKSDDLSGVDSQIKQFKFEQNLKSVLNFDMLENDLNKIQQDYKKASSDSDYNKIMISLLGIEVPESIYIVKSAKLITFYPDKNNMNLDVIKEIGGGNYDMKYEEEYADAILFWNQNNMDTKVTFSEFVASYGYFDERSILRTFEFQINKKNNLDDSYLIIAKLEGIEFLEDYFVRDKPGYLYIELEQDSETIIFTTTADVNFVDVPVFISPELEKLKLAENIEIGEEENGFKWIFFIFILFFLILTGGVVYVILQEWYKRKYESHLFKKKNDLYNLMIYITQERKKGSSDKEIYSKLKKSGWSSEQANYVLRKHSGKRTGMFEIFSFGKKKTRVVQHKLNTPQPKANITKKRNLRRKTF